MPTPAPGPDMPEPTRAAVNGEFGGVTMRVDNHSCPGTVMGYGTTLSSGWKTTKRYQELLRTAYGLRGEPGHQRRRLHAAHRRGAGTQRPADL